MSGNGRDESASPISAVRPSVPPSGAEPGSAKRRLMRPIDEARVMLEALYPAELADVMRFAERLRAARGEVPDPDVRTRVLAVLLRLGPEYRLKPGVPLSVVRVELRDVARVVLDRALLEAEERGVVRLVAESPGAAFVEAEAGIRSRRGLLYYCAAGSR